MNIQEKAEEYARISCEQYFDIKCEIAGYDITYGDISAIDYINGYNEAKRCILVGEQTPPEGVDVLFYNEKWIHPDFNEKGVRIGYVNMNQETEKLNLEIDILRLENESLKQQLSEPKHIFDGVAKAGEARRYEGGLVDVVKCRYKTCIGCMLFDKMIDCEFLTGCDTHNVKYIPAK